MTNMLFSGAESCTEDENSLDVLPFEGLDNLTDLTISSKCKTISNGLFEGMNLLQNLTFDTDTDGSTALEKIEANAFSCTSIVGEIIIPDSVETIERCAFEDCNFITSITTPWGLKTLGQEAFADCDSLTDVYLYSENVNFEQSALRLPNDTILHVICTNYPENVLSYEYGGFSGERENCIFEHGYMDNGVMYRYDFEDVAERGGCFEEGIKAHKICKGCAERVIFDDQEGYYVPFFLRDDYGYDYDIDGDNYTDPIGSHDFETDFTIDVAPTEKTAGSKSKHCTRCDAQSEITVIPKLAPKEAQEGTKLPSNDVSDKSANYVVTSHTSDGKPAVIYVAPTSATQKSVTVPSAIVCNGITYKVTAIADSAFSGNKKVTKVTIPASVTKIGKNAFKNCKNLKTIKITSTQIKSVGKNAFKGIKKGAVIKVPKSKKKAYAKIFKGKLPKGVTLQ